MTRKQEKRAALGAAHTQILKGISSYQESRGQEPVISIPDEDDEIPIGDLMAGLKKDSSSLAPTPDPANVGPLSPPPAWVKGGARTQAKKKYNLLGALRKGPVVAPPPSSVRDVPSSGVPSGEEALTSPGLKDELPRVNSKEVIVPRPEDIRAPSQKRSAESLAEGTSKGKKARKELSSPVRRESGDDPEARWAGKAANLRPEGSEPHVEMAMAAFSADFSSTLWEELSQESILAAGERLTALTAQVISRSSTLWICKFKSIAVANSLRFFFLAFWSRDPAGV